MELLREINYENSTLNETNWMTDYPNTTLNYSLTTEVPYIDYGDRPETYIIPFVFALIFLVGVLGNGCLILIFFRHRTMRNVPNM
jgi:hypothetical protein